MDEQMEMGKFQPGWHLKRFLKIYEHANEKLIEKLEKSATNLQY